MRLPMTDKVNHVSDLSGEAIRRWDGSASAFQAARIARVFLVPQILENFICERRFDGSWTDSVDPNA